MLKSQIRKKIIKIRKEKNNKNIKFSFYKILKQINIRGKIIGGYFPVNFEIDLLDFFKELENKVEKICMPVIRKNNQMDFYMWSTKDLLKLNKFGILEPEQNKKIIPDIVFVPLVAFDDRLYRIGYGGGYYDRYIEKITKRNFLLKIGIAHSCQKINKVPTNKFDKKLDIIITEKYILK